MDTHAKCVGLRHLTNDFCSRCTRHMPRSVSEKKEATGCLLLWKSFQPESLRLELWLGSRSFMRCYHGSYLVCMDSHCSLPIYHIWPGCWTRALCLWKLTHFMQDHGDTENGTLRLKISDWHGQAIPRSMLFKSLEPYSKSGFFSIRNILMNRESRDFLATLQSCNNLF